MMDLHRFGGVAPPPGAATDVGDEYPSLAILDIIA
jgi:hypothetical protein